MIEKTFWHPVAAPAEIGATPHPVTLLETELVLWRDPSTGQVHALLDQCPHRGARLSMGSVQIVDATARLQCAYHGWQFGPGGACARIPAAPALTPTAAQTAKAFRVREAHGLLWVNLSDADTALPQVSGVPGRAVVCGPFDVATSAPRAVENFLDTSHFGFVHGGWLGDLEHTEVPPYEVAHAADGSPGVPHYLAWQPRASSTSTDGAWVDYRYQVVSPYAALLSKQATEPGAHQEGYVLWCCPQTPETCRVWFTMYTDDAAVSDQAMIEFETTIFTQDQAVLESQRPRRLPLSGGEAFSPADKLSGAYRRYLRELAISFGVC